MTGFHTKKGSERLDITNGCLCISHRKVVESATKLVARYATPTAVGKLSIPTYSVTLSPPSRLSSSAVQEEEEPRRDFCKDKIMGRDVLVREK